MHPDEDEYLRSHRWALLSTTRVSGAPQVSMVAYHFDGDDIVISCRRTTAKFVNAARDRRVVVAVPDGRRYLAVAGAVDPVTAGPQLLELTTRLHRSLEPDDAAALQRDLDAGLEQAGRAILRIVPDGITGRL